MNDTSFWPCCMGTNMVEAYDGWRCTVCGALYPFGCEPWLDEEEPPDA
jgi:hypothetical protein